MADSRPASESSGVGEAPWPVIPQPSEAQASPAPPDDDPEDGGGGRGGTLVRVAALVALVAVVTAAGIAIGKAVAPSHPNAATTAPPATTTTPLPPPPQAVHKVTYRWGPLTVQPYGKLPVGPPNAAAAVVGPTLAVVGGTGTGLILAGRLGGKLVPVARLSRPRASAQAFSLGGNLYVLGGEQGGKPADDVLRIDLGTGRGRTVSKFVEPLAEAGVVTRGKSVYLVGGWTGDQYATAILKFTPPSTESLVARLPDGTRSPAVALLGHTLYVAGGRTEQGLSDKAYAIDLGSGAVTTLPALPNPIAGALLVASGSDLYLLGGTGKGGKPSAAVVRIDPATGKATPVGRMPKPLAGAAAVPTESRALVVDPSSGAVYRID
jgi:Galactose oxidase, central domain